MLPALLYQCWPDEAEVQRWYIDREKYDFVLDDGTNVTELTCQNDLRSTVQAGTKIVMRIITEEVVASFSARYQCPCGTWNDVEVDIATLFDGLEHGYLITCCRCKRRFQVMRTSKNVERSTSKRKEEPADVNEPAMKAKYLIRNFVVKQVVVTQYSLQEVRCNS
ncbi:hypothetical protein EDC04DRAFT_1712877 [Pisolithus marmoratus]|nr:hypothetical protein EDC04DRAFT_1712877 [Pisolithus marmoratus]